MSPTFLTILLVVVLTARSGVNSRTIHRSGPKGSVNLVEVNVKGKLYGKCSYNRDGEEISVVFEEANGEMKARATNPTILNPVEEVEQCRETASRPYEPQGRFRTSLVDGEDEESPLDLGVRLMDLQRNIASNEDYINELMPRLFLPFPIPIPSMGNLLFTIGDDENKRSQLNFKLPVKNSSPTSFGFGFPFKSGFFGK